MNTKQLDIFRDRPAFGNTDRPDPDQMKNKVARRKKHRIKTKPRITRLREGLSLLSDLITVGGAVIVIVRCLM